MRVASTPAVLHGPLDGEVAEEVRRLAADAEHHDGVEALGEQTLLTLTEPAGTHLLARSDGRLVGYAGVLDASGPSPTGELVVSPGARRRGWGAALLAGVLSLGSPDGAPAVWAHGDLPPARALARRAGLQVVRELWRMERDLTGALDGRPPTPPEGTTVRPFVVGQDERAWLDLNGRAFTDHPEQGGTSLADVQAREREPWFSPADLLLVEDDRGLLASVWMKVEPGATLGELYVLAVDPSAQGRGLGRFLTAAVLDHLRRRGLDRVALYTEATNTAAVRTYTAAGFATVRTDVQYG